MSPEYNTCAQNRDANAGLFSLDHRQCSVRDRHRNWVLEEVLEQPAHVF